MSVVIASDRLRPEHHDHDAGGDGDRDERLDAAVVALARARRRPRSARRVVERRRSRRRPAGVRAERRSRPPRRRRRAPPDRRAPGRPSRSRRSVARLTVASRTPAVLRRKRSIRLTHEAQVMPSIGRTISIGSAGHTPGSIQAASGGSDLDRSRARPGHDVPLEVERLVHRPCQPDGGAVSGPTDRGPRLFRRLPQAEREAGTVRVGLPLEVQEQAAGAPGLGVARSSNSVSRSLVGARAPHRPEDDEIEAGWPRSRRESVQSKRASTGSVAYDAERGRSVRGPAGWRGASPGSR